MWFFVVCFRAHYIEYLCGLVRDNALDPVIVLSADDLETIVRRAHKRLPPRAYGTPDAKYREALLQVSRAARGERMGARSAHAVISQCFTPRPTFPRSLNFQFGSLHAFYARAPPKLAPPRRWWAREAWNDPDFYLQSRSWILACAREREKLSALCNFLGLGLFC